MKKFLSTLVTFALLMAIMPIMATPASAVQNNVPYILADGTVQYANNVTVIDSNSVSTINLTTGWYIVRGDVLSMPTVSGDVHLILENNCSLMIVFAVTITSGRSLTIYRQPPSLSDGSGAALFNAAVTVNAGGTLNINGGDVTTQSTITNAGTLNLNGGTIAGTAINVTGGAATMNGNAVVDMSTITGTLTTTRGILITGSPAISTFYGTSVTPNTTFRLLGNTTLTIPSDATLTIPSGVAMVLGWGNVINEGMIVNNGMIPVIPGQTLTNNGTIANNGIINNTGTVTNNGTIDNHGTILTTIAIDTVNNDTVGGIIIQRPVVLDNPYVMRTAVSDSAGFTVTGDGATVIWSRGNADGTGLTRGIWYERGGNSGFIMVGDAMVSYVHTWGAWIDDLGGNCTRTCNWCQHTETMVHDIVGVDRIPAMCVLPGREEGEKCSRNCGYDTSEELFSNGHEFSGWIPDGNATCISKGTQTRICTKNGCEESDTVEGDDFGDHTFNPNDCRKCQHCSVTFLRSCDPICAGCEFGTVPPTSAMNATTATTMMVIFVVMSAGLWGYVVYSKIKSNKRNYLK